MRWENIVLAITFAAASGLHFFLFSRARRLNTKVTIYEI